MDDLTKVDADAQLDLGVGICVLCLEFLLRLHGGAQGVDRAGKHGEYAVAAHLLDGAIM